MLFEGYKFGLMLQLAVGPICLLVFNLSSNYGLILGLVSVLGVTIVDSFFILFAIRGSEKLIKNVKVKTILKYAGALILILFGISFIYDSLWTNTVTSITITEFQTPKVFIESIIITASNPMTIIFWASAFSSKVAGGKFTKKDVYLFGMGSVMSTVTFLTVVALIGTITKTFLTSWLIILLNIAVGIVLIGFGIKCMRNPGDENKISI